MISIKLRCEYLREPQSIGIRNPRFSWAIDTLEQNWYQTAYRIIVAKSEAALIKESDCVWDSGKTISAQSIQIVYAGKQLQSNSDYYWKIQVWDQDNILSQWSDVGRLTTGLLDDSDWSAKWIGLESPYPNKLQLADRTLPAFYTRKEFFIKERIIRARMFICGLGYFMAHCNGKRIGQDELVPDLTEYDKRVIYYSYDVTNNLHVGNNALGVVLGNGRFYYPRKEENGWNKSYGLPCLILQLEIELEDGSNLRIITDETWHITDNGPIRANNEYDGEIYDSRLEMPGWSDSGYIEEKWYSAELVEAPGGKLTANMSEPQRVTRIIQPISLVMPEPNLYVLDMGQNMVGNLEFTLEGVPNQCLKFRYAENVMPDGSINLANIREAKVTDTYTFKTFGEITWRPSFTYHGFRYVEISGLNFLPSIDAFKGCVIHSDLERGGHFSCSDKLLNNIYNNILWGIRGNLRSIPTDCPQRDERQGWLGDIANEAKGESYDFFAAPFYIKWLDDIKLTQRPDGSISDIAPAFWPIYADDITWPAAYPICVKWLYDHYSDLRIVETHYPSIKRWLEHLYSYVEEDIFPRDHFGDWCIPPADPYQIHTNDTEKLTSKGVLGTTYLYHISGLAESFAKILGLEQDILEWHKWQTRLKSGFVAKYWDDERGCIDNGTLTSCILPLFFEMLEPEKDKRLWEFFLQRQEHDYNYHVGTGIIGGQWLMRLLSLRRCGDIALKISTQTDYPSYGYMINNGATTIWELWNGNTADPAMNSGNHLMLVGDFQLWLYEHLVGIRPDASVSGFKLFHFRPDYLKGLQWAAGQITSAYGCIITHWRRTENKILAKIKVPANTTAILWVPCINKDCILVNGLSTDKHISEVFYESNTSYTHIRVGSGIYSVEWTEE